MARSFCCWVQDVPERTKAYAAPLLASLGARGQGANLSGAELEALKLASEGIEIDFPPLADTGYSVPLQVEIVAPANPTDGRQPESPIATPRP